MAVRATGATPFKGESFPAYVVSRNGSTVRRPSAPSTSLVLPCTAHSSASTYGPSADTLAQHTVSFTATQPPRLATSFPSPVGCPTKAAVKTPSRLQRPSLSEQLKAISHGAQTITTQLRSSYGLDLTVTTRALQQQSGGFTSTSVGTGDCLLEATTIHLSVGRLDCRFPCPVHFGVDRCSYLFQHPFEPKEIQMVMYYRDMRQTHVNLHERSLRFRIDHPLEQFGEDYRPSNPQHHLKLVFATASEAEKVKRFLTKLKSAFGTASHNNIDQ